jgi:uncharacterized protein with HEPN domain
VRFASGFDFETFQDDSRTAYAVIRCLEVSSQKSGAHPLENPGQKRSDESSSANLPQDIEMMRLEIISEASRRLPEDLKARHPDIEWKQMAGAGNIYRHNYEDVAAHYVWETVQLALPPLLKVVEDELQRLGNE